jgi:AcrR family transcriptional regulator
MDDTIESEAPATVPGAAAEDTRGRILSAAEGLFAEHGFDATSTAQIATAAEVPKGLLFYYFPRKIDVLLTLLAERLPKLPLCDPADVARVGDLVGSLLTMARWLKLGEHDSVVFRIIIHREDSTHRVVRDHLLALREHLFDLTEKVLDAASPISLDPDRRRNAARAFVAVMQAEAYARRLDLPVPDIVGPAEIIVAGLLASS